MKPEDPSGCQAVPAFLELLVDEFLKAIGCRERVDRTPAATHGLAGGIVDIDDIHLFH
jgi:hypothetical protein